MIYYILFFLGHLLKGVPLTSVSLVFLAVTALLSAFRKNSENAQYEILELSLSPAMFSILEFIMACLMMLFFSYLWEYIEVKAYNHIVSCIGDLFLTIKMAKDGTFLIMEALFVKKQKTSA